MFTLLIISHFSTAAFRDTLTMQNHFDNLQNQLYNNQPLYVNYVGENNTMAAGWEGILLLYTYITYFYLVHFYMKEQFNIFKLNLGNNIA